MNLAAELEGAVTIGLNRRLDNIDNTIAAARLAVDTIDNLYAIELGNEPECENPYVSRNIVLKLTYVKSIARLILLRRLGAGRLLSMPPPKYRGKSK
jgi:hypothetical protein